MMSRDAAEESAPAVLFAVAGGFFFVGAVLASAGTAVYVSHLPQAQRGGWNVVYVYAGVGAVFGGALYAARNVLPRRVALALPFVAIAVNGAPMVTGRTVTATGAILMIWPVIYASVLLTEELAWATVAVGVAALVAASVFDSAQTLAAYGTVAATLVLTGYVTISLERRVKALIGRLTDEARTDALTGLANRRALLDALRREAAAHRRRRAPLALWMIDIDRFKSLNDTAGHSAGDEALRRLADLLGRQVRGGDLAARYGGEEFTALLVDCALPDAVERAEHFRKLLETASAEWPNPITASIGVSVLCPGSGSVDGVGSELIDRADAALYAAKDAGRNRVRSSEA